MSASWTIQQWPALGYDVFLSHCAEDKKDVVAPVHARLKKEKLIPWFDQNDYPVAADPHDALRKNLIRCRHVVYFITPNFLRQGRGWCAVERSYSELIQRHFSPATEELWCFELPLIFLPRTDVDLGKLLQRSAWNPIIAKGCWFDDRTDRSITPINWAVRQIKKLIQQQTNDATALADRLRSDTTLASVLKTSAKLAERVTSLLPRTR